MGVIETTLCLFMKDNKILLAKKKRGFGEGKYNGIGGKLEPGETSEEAMIRECQEEVCVTPLEYEKVGYILFDEFFRGEKKQVAFHLYISTKWKGDVVETEEMAPFWFDKDKIPYDKMFSDDKYWLPLILEGKKINAYFEFDENWNILSKNIKEEDRI